MRHFAVSEDATTPDEDELWVSTRDLLNAITGRTLGDDYETAVFNVMGKPVHTQRYATEEEALEGHKAVVSSIKVGAFAPNGKTWSDFK